jgi:predicted GIY-YIG superfamily endonuclease
MTPAARPQTIQIFLPLGDPRGLRIAEITTRIVQLIEVPRPQLDVFLTMPESEQVAVYFLFGHSEDGAEQKVYIGQTGDLRKRLVSHNKDKDFWQRALVLTSRTASLTQTHGLFLEWQCIQAARQAGRYLTENGTAGTRPHTPAPLEADCMEIFDTGRTQIAKAFERHSFAERRVGGGVRGVVERVAGLEDGARGDAERGEARGVSSSQAGGLRPIRAGRAYDSLPTCAVFRAAA